MGKEVLYCCLFYISPWFLSRRPLLFPPNPSFFIFFFFFVCRLEGVVSILLFFSSIFHFLIAFRIVPDEFDPYE